MKAVILNKKNYKIHSISVKFRIFTHELPLKSIILTVFKINSKSKLGSYAF